MLISGDPVAKIDAALLPPDVHFAQDHREPRLETPVQIAILRVLVRIEPLSLVLLPRHSGGHGVIAPGKLGADLARDRLRARPPFLELQFRLARIELSLELTRVPSPATSGQSLRPAAWARLRQSESAVLLHPGAGSSRRPPKMSGISSDRWPSCRRNGVRHHPGIASVIDRCTHQRRWAGQEPRFSAS